MLIDAYTFFAREPKTPTAPAARQSAPRGDAPRDWFANFAASLPANWTARSPKG